MPPTAVFLESEGHHAILWLPLRKGTALPAAGEKLTPTGALDGAFATSIAAMAQDLVAASDVVLLALQGYGQKAALDAMAPHLRDG